jgi:DNA-binding MarR family transcriptional regulator
MITQEKTHLEQQAHQLYELFPVLFAMPKEQPFPELELSAREFQLLHLLYKSGSHIMSGLAAQMATPLSTLTRVVDRLQKKGLIERVRQATDRRVVQVQLTADGRRIEAHCEKWARQIARKMLEPLSLGEREILLELMAKAFLQLL